MSILTELEASGYRLNPDRATAFVRDVVEQHLRRMTTVSMPPVPDDSPPQYSSSSVPCPACDALIGGGRSHDPGCTFAALLMVDKQDNTP